MVSSGPVALSKCSEISTEACSGIGPQTTGGSWRFSRLEHDYMGLSENGVPLNPMVLLVIIPIKWL